MKQGIKVLDVLLAVILPTSVISKSPQHIKQAMASTAFASSSAGTRGILQRPNDPHAGVAHRANVWYDTTALLARLRLGAPGSSSPAGSRQLQIAPAARAGAASGIRQLHSSASPDRGSLKPLNKAIHEDASVCARKAWHNRRGLLPKDVKSLEAAQHLMQQGTCGTHTYTDVCTSKHPSNMTKPSSSRRDFYPENNSHRLSHSLSLSIPPSPTFSPLLSLSNFPSLPDLSQQLSHSPGTCAAGIDFEAEFIAHRYTDRPSVTITVEGTDGALERSAAITRDEMSRIVEANEVGTAILQATLMKGGVVARADALEYAGSSEWDVLEVKSCAKTKSSKPPLPHSPTPRTQIRNPCSAGFGKISQEV